MDTKTPETPQASQQKTRRLMWRARALGFGGVILLALLFYRGLPPELGVQNQQLTPCPNTPNCVSTFATNSAHALDALDVSAYTTAEVMAAVREAALALPRVRLLEETASTDEGYINLAYRSRIMRFVDDVEFYLVAGQLHTRHAARLGRSDFGVNRARAETLMQQISAQLRGS